MTHVTNSVETEGTLDSTNVTMETESTWMGVMSSVSKKNKELKWLVEEPSSLCQSQWPTDIDALLATLSLQTSAMTGVEMGKGMMTRISATREGICTRTCKSSATMETKRTGTGVMRGAG